MDLLSPSFLKWYLALPMGEREALVRFLSALTGVPEWPQRGTRPARKYASDDNGAPVPNMSRK